MAFLEFHKQRLNEMGQTYGKVSKSYFNREDEFEQYKESYHLIKKNINSKGMMIFSQTKTSLTYFLTDKNKKYLGFVEFQPYHSNSVVKISASNSQLSGGFYNIIFSAILTFTVIEEILSDTDLSDNAMKAYENLNKQPSINVRVFDGSEYSEFSESNFKLSSHNRVSIKSRNLKESFRNLEELIIESTFLKNLFENSSDEIDQRFIYGTSIEDINFGDI